MLTTVTMKSRPRITCGAMLGAILAAGPAMARADGNDASVIHACVNPNSGEIHIVGVSDACPPNELALAWNVQGPPGGTGVSGYEIVTHQEFLAAGSFANVHVDCPAGKKVLGGGFDIETPDDVKVFSSEPSDGQGNITDHGWNVFVHNAGTMTRQTTVSAICALVQ